MMIKVHLLEFFYMCFCVIICAGSSRRIKCEVNSELSFTTQEEPTNIVHIVSEGEDDNIHFLWSTYKLPSVIVSRTTKNTTLLVNAEKLKSFEKDAIQFKDGEPLESIGVTFSKMWELHYENDSSKVTEISSVEDLDMQSFQWSNASELLDCSDTFASVTLKANANETVFSKSGSLQIQFSVSGNQELSKEFPHLVFTGNSTLLKFVLDNLYSNFSKARYGFEISLFSVLSGDCDTDKWKTTVTKSINDEMSPGVFSVVELRAPCSHDTHANSAFLSWRPVAYIGPKPIVANSSDVTLMEHPQPSLEVRVQSIAELYFQSRSNSSSFNITFGTPGDGFYAATKYTAWSIMIGTGSTVDVPFSSIIIILASIGIGLLTLFLIAGSVFILFRKCREKDDDLLLN